VAFTKVWQLAAATTARLVAGEVSWMVVLGSLVGVGLRMALARYMESLFCQVQATDLQMLAIPALAIVAGAVLAALRPVIRALRIDPATMLRVE
jgi:pheromone shutdown protein TraB